MAISIIDDETIAYLNIQLTVGIEMGELTHKFTYTEKCHHAFTG